MFSSLFPAYIHTNTDTYTTQIHTHHNINFLSAVVRIKFKLQHPDSVRESDAWDENILSTQRDRLETKSLLVLFVFIIENQTTAHQWNNK